MMMRKVLSVISVLCLLSVAAASAAAVPARAGKVDVDLTALSSTMIFGEVFNMTMNPKDYLGKTVKMRGAYATSHSDESKRDYHFVVIADTAACCQQGLEFIWNGKHNFPADYPTEKTWVEVTGVYDSYEVLGNVHYYVKTEEIVIVK